MLPCCLWGLGVVSRGRLRPMSPGVDGRLMRSPGDLLGVVSRSDEKLGVSLRLLERDFDSKDQLRSQRYSDCSSWLMGSGHAFQCL